MIPNPIHKVLSTLCTHEVQYLLMGGQACVLYGGAEFSRDCDIAILCDRTNLDRLRAALTELQAEVIAVPPFAAEFLERGHAVHFRCQSPDAKGLRLDVMSHMRGVAAFNELWSRRTTLQDDSGTSIEVLALPDLIRAKETQRDKDWPMIRRLVEAHYAEHSARSTSDDVRFWLANSRTPEMLLELAAMHAQTVCDLLPQRPLLQSAQDGKLERLVEALSDEENRKRQADREYWQPLKAELESMRRGRRA